VLTRDMTWQIRTIANYGTKHPIVARLQVQSGNLLDYTNLGSEQKEAIFETSVVSSTRLMNCDEIAKRILGGIGRIQSEYAPPSNKNGAIEVPQLLNLQRESENFLYEAKNFLRDYTGVVNGFLGSDFQNASEFIPQYRTGQIAIAELLTTRFGAQDQLVRRFSENSSWLSEIIWKRNAIEHPGGHSGNLHMNNFVLADGILIPPTWYRNNNPPKFVAFDMQHICVNLLSFAESIFVRLVSKHLADPILQVYSIPEAEINPSCPERYTVSLSQSAAESLALAEEQGGSDQNGDPK